MTWANTRYRNDLVGRDTGTPLDPALFLLPGDNLSNAPSTVVTGSVAWTPPIGSSGLSALFYADARLSSNYNTGSDLFTEKEQDAYEIVNARIGIRGRDQRWSIELWAQNIFDTDYQQVAFNAPFQGGNTIAQVQAFGAQGVTCGGQPARPAGEFRHRQPADLQLPGRAADLRHHRPLPLLEPASGEQGGLAGDGGALSFAAPLSGGSGACR